MHIILGLLFVLSVAQQDAVTGIVPEYTHPWYSGFLNLTNNRSLHYVFFESQMDSNNDPLVVWMGGKLGCSSLLGMAKENGPFKFTPNSTEYFLNNHSWNKHASVLYLETTAPVGFSVGTNNNSDESVARDNLEALQNFLSKYPTFRKNELYLSGSGYVGVSGPYLAIEIHHHNLHPTTAIKINLKGLLLGNPCIDPSECYVTGIDGRSIYSYQFLYDRVFYTEQDYKRMLAACVLAWSGTACYEQKSLLDQLFRDTKTPSQNIYQKCYFQQDHYGDIQCEDTQGPARFFNQPLNKDALHVEKTGNEWTTCSHEVGYKYRSNPNSSYPLFETLTKLYRVWIYSGDVSADVPIVGTVQTLQKMREQFHIPVMEPWREWWLEGKHEGEDQVAGMVWKLSNITLVTVKEGGFQVGDNKPAEQEAILTYFLSSKDLPRKNNL